MDLIWSSWPSWADASQFNFQAISISFVLLVWILMRPVFNRLKKLIASLLSRLQHLNNRFLVAFFLKKVIVFRMWPRSKRNSNEMCLNQKQPQKRSSVPNALFLRQPTWLIVAYKMRLSISSPFVLMVLFFSSKKYREFCILFCLSGFCLRLFRPNVLAFFVVAGRWRWTALISY